MKIRSFLVSFPKFGHFSHTPLRFLSIYRTEIIDNQNSRMNLQQELNDIRCLKDGLCLYDEMMRIRPLPSVIQFTQLLSRLVKLEEYSAAVRLYRDFCCLRIPNNAYTMNIAVNCYCHLNRIDFGFSILGSFFKRGFVPNAFTYTALLKGLFGENRGNEALELFTKIVGERLCELNVVVYGVVIDGLCKSGGVAPAMELLRIMEKGTCKPNTHVYNMIIDALCRDKLVDSALKLFDEMSEKGIRPDVFTYTSLICGMCILSRWGEVDVLLKHMVKRKVHPDVVTFSSIINALCNEGLVDRAEQVLNIMEQLNIVPNLVTYNTWMHGYCLQGRLNDAWKVFFSMADKSVTPNVRSFNILINGYCKSMKIDEARHLLQAMKRRGLEPDFRTYTTLLDGLFHIGNSEEALLLLDELEQKGDVHIQYYSVVMNAFCEEDELDKARAIFNGLGSKGLEPDVVTYNILIKGCCQHGFLDEAKDLIFQMGHTNLLPNSICYNCITQACLKEGEHDDAAKFVEEMVDMGFGPDANTLELVFNLPGTVENNPTLLRIARKLAPETFRNKNIGE